MNKKLTFLLALTFLFLFSSSVYCQETEFKREYWDNGKLKSEVPHNGMGTKWYESGRKKSETHYKNGVLDGLKTHWYESGRKKLLRHYKNGIDHGVRKEWDEIGNLTFRENYIDGLISYPNENEDIK